MTTEKSQLLLNIAFQMVNFLRPKKNFIKDLRYSYKSLFLKNEYQHKKHELFTKFTKR